MNLRKQNGVAALLVIVIIVVAVGAGGAAALGVRAVVTGENYLAPFEELGWITLSEDDDTEEVVSDEVVEELPEPTHYEISIDPVKILEVGVNIFKEAQSSISSSLGIEDDEEEEEYDIDDAKEIFDLAEVIVDIYAYENELTEVAIYLDYGEALEAYYDYAVENEPESVEDYDTYDDFVTDLYDEMENEGVTEDAILDYYESLLDELEIEYDETVLKDLIYYNLDKDNGTFECSVSVPDEVNVYVSDLVDSYSDVILDYTEEYLGFAIDIDNYVDEVIKIAVAAINSFEDGILTLKIDDKKADLSDYEDIDLVEIITAISEDMNEY